MSGARSRRTVAIWVFGLCAATAHATSAPPDPALAEAMGRLRASGIVLLPPVDGQGAAWTAERVADLEAGLSRLPPRMRDFPGGPLELALHPMPMPLGMGVGTRARPDWSFGRGRFHLYAYLPAEERRAQWRLERLTLTEQERLWRQRAVVHAVMQRWEDALRLGQRHAWRRLNGWLRPYERPFTLQERALNVFEGAYSRALGQRSAALDLVTFAEEYFVPSEALREDALPVEDQVRCQEFSKVRALTQLLHQAGLMESPAEPARCPSFEAWAELDSLSHLEVLLVAASGRRAESLFGHILLRPVHHVGDHVRGRSFQTAVQVAAVTDPVERGLPYLIRGIFGGYRITVFTLSLGDLEREVLETDQRTIRRFRVNLDKEANRRVLERVWEFERRGYFNYQFFTDNCATALAHMIEGALDEDTRVRMPGTFIVSPTSALDGLAAVRLSRTGAEGAVEQVPLLTFVEENIESSRDAAERSEALRLRTEGRLRALLPPDAWAVWGPALARAHVPDPTARAEAFDELAGLTGAAVAARADVRDLLYAWWALTVRIERYPLDLAQRDRQLLDLATVLPGALAPVDPDEEVRARQAVFERESALARNEMILDRGERLRKRLEEAPRRWLTPGEIAQRARLDATLETFARLTEVHGDLVERHFADAEPLAWLEADRTGRVQAQAEASESALPASGSWRTSVGAGARLPQSGAPVPVISVHSAALSELLGDQRIRGFQPSSEMHILEAELLLRPRVGLPEVLRGHYTLFAYRSLLREIDMYRTSVLDNFGWGMGAVADTRPDRQLDHQSQLYAELHAILDQGPRYQRFTTLGVGAQGLVAFGGGTPTAGLGPRVSLTSRLPLGGHSANALRLEATWQTAATAQRRLTWFHAGRARLSADWVVGDVNKRAALIRPQLTAELTREGASPAVRDLTAALMLEILSR
jgi:hypothetical protein